MANPVNNSLQGQLIAAELSQAAYTPYLDFYNGATSYVDDVTHERLPLTAWRQRAPSASGS
jgi:hypothetical protein